MVREDNGSMHDAQIGTGSQRLRRTAESAQEASLPVSRAGLAVRDVAVGYEPHTPVLRGASFDVEQGEVIALLGPSGGGKSTLLRAIAGLEPLSAGSISWDGIDLAGVPPHRRGFGLVFQDGQLFVHRNVAENVAYGLRVRKVPKHARMARVSELLDLVGLSGFEHRHVADLSGGERQRIALARSLAPNPKLLLLDEPLSALDRSLRERLAVDLAHLLRRTETTTILVTHDEEEARAIADRVLRLRDGRVETA